MTPELVNLIKKYSDVEPISFTTYLSHRKRELEDYPSPLKDEISKGFVVSANEDEMERMLYAKSFRDLGYETFIVEFPHYNNEEGGVMAIAPLQSDLEAVLWMQTGRDRDEALPFDIVKTLGDWRDYCVFKLTGAGTNWIKLDFENLPNDLEAFAVLIVEFCPDVLNGNLKTEESLIEQLQNDRSIIMRWRASF